ncbi:hypothetical protein SAMN06297144_1191 [Sphingomonas guangdongensis]|uniref:SpoVT-AbrB domain-containing protein n=2 Tax=Sphingomonas guangdongensis TaxID=1141890 RepID=A0A285QKV2_9SPHN|nr:hypothetical protein SAMN06297144_1191 [Sphingomonas guangdongensis]
MIEGAWTEAVAVSSKERVTLPAAVRARLSWFGKATDEGLLATLDPQGRSELSAWTTSGSRAVGDVAQRLEAAAPDDRDDLAIAAMDRYMRLAVEPPARLALPFGLAVHLDAVEGGVVRIVVSSSRLWLWSERQWQARRMDRIDLLTGSAN